MIESPTRFGEVAATLAANGYRPLPIAPGKKYPGFANWQAFEFTPGCERRFPDYGAGILLGELVAVDVDVDDPDAAAAIEQVVREVAELGDAATVPRRFGNAPRVLLPFRAATPFRKLTSASFKLRSTGTTGKVEILAEGQQFVAFAMHPTTHRPYMWNGGGDLLTVPARELPLLTEEQARRIVREAEAILEEWGDRIGEKNNEEQRGDGRGDVHEGGRNAFLTREAGRLRRLGLSAAAIAAALQEINVERCEPPLAREEVETIAKSVGRYESGASEPNGTATPERSTEWPGRIDLVALGTRRPTPPAFIVRDWLPAGYATLLAGHGGSGKSSIAMFLAVCIALGRAFFGLPTERRRVSYLSCEDREDVLHWRLTRICEHLGTDLAELDGWLDLRDLVGRETTFWARDPKTGDTVTLAFHRLAEQVETHHPQVLFVDGISDTFGGNENARSEVKAYVNRLLSLVPLDGSLVLIGHVPKLTAQAAGSAEGYSGSTGWHNAVRARWYLYPETELDEDAKRARRTGRLTLELQKTNHGRSDQALSFGWDDDAHLFIAEPVTISDLDRSYRDDTERRAILASIAGCEKAGIVVPSATQGRRTAFNVLALRPEFPPSLRGSKARFWREIEHLRQIRHVDEREYRRANRHHAAQFVLTAEGRAQCVD